MTSDIVPFHHRTSFLTDNTTALRTFSAKNDFLLHSSPVTLTSSPACCFHLCMRHLHVTTRLLCTTFTTRSYLYKKFRWTKTYCHIYRAWSIFGLASKNVVQYFHLRMLRWTEGKHTAKLTVFFFLSFVSWIHISHLHQASAGGKKWDWMPQTTYPRPTACRSLV